MPDLFRSLGLIAQSGLIVAMIAGTLIAVIARWRRTSAIVSPTVPAWSFLEILFGFVMFFIIPGMLLAMLESVGFFRAIYGVDFPLPPPPRAESTPDQDAAQTLRQLWAVLLAAPLLGWFVFALSHEASGTTPRDVGLTFDNAPTQIVRGYRVWLWLTPIVFAIYLGANAFFWYVCGVEPAKHSLTKLVPNAEMLTWFLFGLQVIVAGPFVEELLFRGWLLPWLAMKSERSMGCMVAALVIAQMTGLSVNEAEQPNWLRHAPSIFVLAIIPIVAFNNHRPQLAAIIASATLFGAFHSTVWPTPIPLFALGLGLGWMMTRSRNLIGPMIVHGLFNAVSLGYLMLGGE